MPRHAYIEIMGYVAGVLTTVAYLPQLIRTFRTKCANDLSYIMLAVLSLGVWLWCLYGFLISSLPVVLANFFTGIFTCAILALKLRYDLLAKAQRSRELHHSPPSTISSGENR
jgi:MtN3 and saliva related transmembrane protein